MDGVPSLWERRYNLSSADSSLAPVPFSSRKPPHPMSCNPVRPGSTAISVGACRPSSSSLLATRPLPLSRPASWLLLFLRFRDGTSCRTGIPSDTQNG